MVASLRAHAEHYCQYVIVNAEVSLENSLRPKLVSIIAARDDITGCDYYGRWPKPVCAIDSERITVSLRRHHQDVTLSLSRAGQTRKNILTRAQVISNRLTM